MCQGGICVSTDPSFNFTMLVSLPEGSFYAPGLTVPIVFQAQKPPCTPSSLYEQCLSPCSEVTSIECVQIPAVVEPVGALLVSNGIAVDVGAESYVNNASQTTTALPVHVQYRPLWPPLDDSSVHVEAPTVGLPLLPTNAELLQRTIGVNGPGGTQATEWQAPLGPGTYERAIVPDYPAFPVITSTVQAANDTFLSVQVNVDPAGQVAPGTVPAETLQVTNYDGSPLPAGYSVYLADSATLRRVSSMTTLTGQQASCSATEPCAPGNWCTSSTSSGVCQPLLVTIGAWTSKAAPTNLDVVVAPPPGSPVPYLADPVVTSLSEEQFPALPSPVVVSGSVVGPDRAPVVASLVIDSTASVGGTGGIIITSTDTTIAREQPFLHYATSAQTDGAGNYSVTLPPGTYDVFVAPVPGSNLAATSLTLEVAPALGPGPPVAAGKNLVLSLPGTMTGRATVADGRPLAGATVQALPAASLAASLVPTTADPRRWPRPGTTTTDATGAFALALDPGLYDVVVQPANGTGLPWVTLSGQTVFAGETTELLFGAPLSVPAPMVQDLLLHDPSDNPIIRAVVRVYASAASSKNPTQGAPAPMIEIGSWLTDTSGHVTMLLAPPR
jgi:hypothetical protein